MDKMDTIKGKKATKRTPLKKQNNIIEWEVPELEWEPLPLEWDVPILEWDVPEW